MHQRPLPRWRDFGDALPPPRTLWQRPQLGSPPGGGQDPITRTIWRPTAIEMTIAANRYLILRKFWDQYFLWSYVILLTPLTYIFLWNQFHKSLK